MGRLPDFDGVGWRSLTQSQPLDIGVRNNGTLWAWTITQSSDDQVDGGLAVRMEQIGNETNWVSVTAGIDTDLVAIKADGTLWKWEYPVHELMRLTHQNPIRLGIHNDWIAAGSVRNGTVSLAADGSLWHWWTPDFNFEGSVDQPLLAASRKPVRIGNVMGH